MAIQVRTSPLPTELANFQLRDPLFGQLETFFNRFFDDFCAYGKTQRQHTGYPRIDVYQTEFPEKSFQLSSYVVEVAVPGVRPEDIKVEVESGIEYTSPLKVDDRGLVRDTAPAAYLHVSGKMESEPYPPNVTFLTKELTRKTFRRSIPIPTTLKDIRNPVCKCKNGLLTISWVRETSGPDKIETRTTVPIQTG